MTRYNREDSRTVLPQLEKQINELQAHDYIIEQGEKNGWVWRKWDSGRYEAEKKEDYGTVAIDFAYATIEGAVKLYGSGVIPTNMPLPPHTLKSGSVEVEYLGNSTGYTFIARTQTDKILLFRLGSAGISVSNVILLYRVVNGTWK